MLLLKKQEQMLAVICKTLLSCLEHRTVTVTDAEAHGHPCLTRMETCVALGSEELSGTDPEALGGPGCLGDQPGGCQHQTPPGGHFLGPIAQAQPLEFLQPGFLVCGWFG